MEYVDGETLTQRLASHPEFFNKKNTEKLLRQLLDAIGYLHAHQVLHLDLKPDNIMLTRIGNDVKLVDLGFCYTDTFVDTQGRTDRFAAPEQLTGDNVDERTDIYALGRIIELLPEHDIYKKVIARCVAKAPIARYQVVDDLRNAIFPKKKNWLLYVLVIPFFLLLFVCLFLVNNHRTSIGTGDVPSVVQKENTETLKVINHVEPAEQLKSNDEVSSTQSIPDAQPIKRELTEEEKEFLNKPELRIVSSEEFERYKQQLDEYFSEANAFLNDSTNFQKYPLHITYLGHYYKIIHRTLERIKADEWFGPLYKSPMNPVSSYTRKYRDSLDARASVNSNKLP
jgi:serine/threonine protein kinase